MKAQHILWCLVAIVACKPFEMPEPEGPLAPIFYVEGRVNGEDWNLQADGVLHEVVPTAVADSNGFSLLGALLQPIGCCDDAIEIVFVQLKGQALTEGQRPVAGTYPDSFLISLKPKFHAEQSAGEWRINGSDFFTTEPGESLEFSWPISGSATWLDVRYTAVQTDGCRNTLHQRVYLPTHGCGVRITIDTLAANSYQYKAVVDGSENFDYSWHFSSGATASSREVMYTYHNTPTGGFDSVSVSVDNGTCQATFNMKQVVVNDSSQCIANASGTAEPQSNEPTGRLKANEVLISLKRNGRLYSSQSALQSSRSGAVVGAVSTYTEKGKTYYWATGTIDAVVASETDTLRLENVEFSLPVGIVP